MSHRRTSRGGALLRRLLRAQLRLKVMAGVLLVTLIALVAFDVGAVTTMRRYLLTQTDNNLREGLTLTTPRLNAMLSGGSMPGRSGGPHAVPVQVETPPKAKYPPLPGAFDIAFLPFHGGPVTLQVAANGGAGGYSWTLSPRAAQVADRPGPHTLVSASGRAQIRIQSLRVAGGSLVAGTSLDQVTKTIDQVELIVTFGSIAVVLLIGLGVFVVLRRGLHPIEAMARQADRITAGDLTDRVTPHQPRSEVGRLGAALNGMLARIEAGLHEREASEQQMRRFFADASHELRTPLASLRANAELYQQGALCGPDEVDEVMERIVLETRRMGRLVDDMLRLARLGQHPGQSCEPVDVTAVVTGCAERVRVADPARTWRVRIADSLTTVGDEELLRRAVDNLLMNVLVHTPGDTVGTITAAAVGGRVTIEVSDDGPGVPPDKLPHIFERFYRAGGPVTRSRSISPTTQPRPAARVSPAIQPRPAARVSPAIQPRPAARISPTTQPRPTSPPGSGLGLAIATEIASAHGGTAQAASVSPHGLQITLTLPVRQPSGPRSARELAASVS